MILVIWMTRSKSGKYTDHWLAYKSTKEAKAQYEQLVNQVDVYSALICTVVKVTEQYVHTTKELT